MADFSLLTIAELEAEFIRLGHLLATLQDTRHAMYQLILKRKAEAASTHRVALLSPIEKDALKAVLQ